MPLNKKEIPYIILNSFKSLQSQCKIKASENAEILNCEIDTESLSVRFSDKQIDSEFFFSIRNLILQPKPAIVVATFSFYPQTENLLREINLQSPIDESTIILDQWIGRLKLFNNFSLTQEDKFEKKYQEDYYTEFQMVDEDADTLPFEIKKQQAFIVLLNFIEERIVKGEFQDKKSQEIFEQTKLLKNNIQNLTKNQALNWFSKIKAKIYMKGEDFSNYIWGVGKNEFSKYLINKGIEWASNYVIHLLHNL